eukprot:TRINITY_DN4131_c0_g1_i1.p1 TRINITY_DN4131_c0_g1~~TRINITY_DN4131_c0_g1_i1.p1  ORF type:complete len:105 (+),score=0.60 TRINITY_DN4131_c0_g1_i1:191-505(+)
MLEWVCGVKGMGVADVCLAFVCGTPPDPVLLGEHLACSFTSAPSLSPPSRSWAGEGEKADFTLTNKHILPPLLFSDFSKEIEMSYPMMGETAPATSVGLAFLGL